MNNILTKEQVVKQIKNNEVHIYELDEKWMGYRMWF